MSRSPLDTHWYGQLCAATADDIATHANRMFGDEFFTFVAANSYNEEDERFTSVDVDTSQRIREPFTAKRIGGRHTRIGWSQTKFSCGIWSTALTESGAHRQDRKQRVRISFCGDRRMIIDHFAIAGYRLQWQLIVEDHA